ncbi:unnamed protein product [Parascedosporium putredinis]|uniref:Uncharacterized protein n=1 Tax=Parascedosporium putredinis TaxID=1442378 RepID=A0A9P1GZ54_9PEZI|nr:unnamed protein product [Parascedosporium putredinis]CAI7991394.1 unnamed protein product [Parascedosporium putredinis]
MTSAAGRLACVVLAAAIYPGSSDSTNGRSNSIFRLVAASGASDAGISESELGPPGFCRRFAPDDGRGRPASGPNNLAGALVARPAAASAGRTFVGVKDPQALYQRIDARPVHELRARATTPPALLRHGRRTGRVVRRLVLVLPAIQLLPVKASLLLFLLPRAFRGGRPRGCARRGGRQRTAARVAVGGDAVACRVGVEESARDK